MNRKLLSKILTQMKSHLKDGKSIGDMKVSALLALGQQLEAIYYYLGHELGTILQVRETKNIEKISEALISVISQYNIGKVEIVKTTNELIQLKLRGHSSIKDLINIGIEANENFCSFEAGLLAGIVEKMSDMHCFAQELNTDLSEGHSEFMIVFQEN
jgi:predicted hydrocarbon binding protein